MAAMPAHWQVKNPELIKDPTPEEQDRFPKDPKKYREYIGLQNYYAVDTRDLLLGALVSYETYLTLLADASKTEMPTAKLKQTWPELAYYDCYACHHTLTRDTAANTTAAERISSRQQRGYQKNVPGRPSLQSWQATLAKIALQHSALKVSLDPVHDELNAAPFGDRAKLAAVFDPEKEIEPTKELRKAAAKLNSELDPKARAGIPPEQARQEDLLLATKVLQALIELGATELQEYDAARQLVWAVEVVSREYLRLHPEPTLNHEAFQQFLEKDPHEKQSKMQLWKFDLPKRVVEANANNPPNNGQPIADNIRDWLQARTNYQPAVLRQKFITLRDALKLAKPVTQ